MECYCDKCKYENEWTLDNIHVKKYKNYTIHYYQCVACKEKYICRVYNNYIDKELKKIDKLNKEYLASEDEIDKALLRVKFESLLFNLKIHNARLRDSLVKELGKGWR